MAFGPIMRVRVSDELLVELAPLARDIMGEFISPGMQQFSILKYLELGTAPTLEDEEEWYETTRKQKDSLVWGVYVLDGDERVLIGTTSIHNIVRKHMHQAATGSLLFRQEYWRKGIAKGIHQARTWYAFQQLGLHRLKSCVIAGNVGSAKALKHSGYDTVYIERNTHFVDGSLRDTENLECLNPNEPFWSQWWHGERVPAKSRVARQRTLDAFEWVSEHVTLL